MDEPVPAAAVHLAVRGLVGDRPEQRADGEARRRGAARGAELDAAQEDEAQLLEADEGGVEPAAQVYPGVHEVPWSVLLVVEVQDDDGGAQGRVQEGEAGGRGSPGGGEEEVLLCDEDWGHV